MDRVILVSEDELERAVTLFATVEKTVAEGAGAAGLAALLAEPEHVPGPQGGAGAVRAGTSTRASWPRC